MSSDKIVNFDSTPQKAGDMFQYIIALNDCFDMQPGDSLYIEKYGDVSCIKKEGSFQKEIKHHFEDQNLSERDIDLWKTLANWYEAFEEQKIFSELILYTTANIQEKSCFNGWNAKTPQEKLDILKEIGKEQKKNEETFRRQYNRIFDNQHDEIKLLNILERMKIMCSQTKLLGVSLLFDKHSQLHPIPKCQRDRYIGALLGQILFKIKDPPNQWNVSFEEFEAMQQMIAPAYMDEKSVSLPDEFACVDISEEIRNKYNKKRFAKAIHEINLQKKVSEAVSDYWKTEMTIANYFRDNPVYMKDYDGYRNDLKGLMEDNKDFYKVDVGNGNDAIAMSQKEYLTAMQWDPKDFGTIVQNRRFFQHGVMHDIVEVGEFEWKIEVESDEHK